jgi:hypothetical protein
MVGVADRPGPADPDTYDYTRATRDALLPCWSATQRARSSP